MHGRSLYSPLRRRLLAGTAAALAAHTLPVAAQPAAPGALERIRAKGVLTVAVYRDFAPFHLDGQGIDVDLAGAVAARLGVKASLLPFDEGEDLNDDLRNMVWRGHYLGYGPADVMVHVPVDPSLMASNERALIFAPYYREMLWLARDLSRIPQFGGMASLVGHRVGAEGTGLGALMLVSAENGRLRDSMSVHRTPREAIAALRRGEVAAVMALRSELESELAGDARYAMSSVPIPGPAATGWPVGFAVKKDHEDLARAVQGAVNALRESGELAAIFRKHRVEPTPP